MENAMITVENAIIIDGKVYEAVPRNSWRCQDCILTPVCDSEKFEHVDVGLCEAIFKKQNIKFRFSQTLTDKINGK